LYEILNQLTPGVRVYDRRRGKERLIQAIEIQNSITYLSLRDPKTGEIERLEKAVAEVLASAEREP
jgi:hypothetical protein